MKTAIKMTQMEDIYLHERLLRSAILNRNIEESEEILGMIQTIEKPQLATTSIRSKKNYYIRLCYLLEWAFIDVGYDGWLMQKMTKEYVKEIENRQSDAQVETCYNQLIYTYMKLLKNQRGTQGIIERAKYLIGRRIQDTIKLEEIAEELGITPIYLSSLFKKELKINFTDYINQLKIKASLDYLRGSNLTISMIACQLGFCNQSYYSSIFKKVMGETPVQYRKRIS